MGAPLERVFVESHVPEYIRTIDRDYHIEMIADDTQQLRQYHTELFRSQAQFAATNLRAMGELARWQDVTNSHLGNIAVDSRSMVHGIERLASGMDRLNTGVDRLNTGVSHLNAGVNTLNQGVAGLNETAKQSLNAIYELSDTLSENLDGISNILLSNQQTLNQIAETLSKPYETKARELRREAQKWLTSGMKNTGRDRTEDWKDAMRLLQTTADNPIGMQDYVVWFQLGWLRWKMEDNLAEAEEAFYRAQRLSAPNSDLYHQKSLRHLAYMQYLQGKFAEAYETIQKAVNLKRNHDHLYDAARYSAAIGKDKQVIDLLDRCIRLRPSTIVTMFAEKDFEAVFADMTILASQRLAEARIEAKKGLTCWSDTITLVQEIARAAGCVLALPDNLTTGIPELNESLSDSDYLTTLDIKNGANAKRKQILQEAVKLIQAEKSPLQTKISQIETQKREIEREKSQAATYLSSAKYAAQKKKEENLEAAKSVFQPVYQRWQGEQYLSYDWEYPGSVFRKRFWESPWKGPDEFKCREPQDPGIFVWGLARSNYNVRKREYREELQKYNRMVREYEEANSRYKAHEQEAEAVYARTVQDAESKSALEVQKCNEEIVRLNAQIQEQQIPLQKIADAVKTLNDLVQQEVAKK